MTATSWQWDFENDGIIDATVQNPDWDFWQEGTYSVRLIASNGANNDTIIRQDYINVNGEQISNALQFDGQDDFVKAGGVPFPSGDLTIEAWIFPIALNGYQEVVFFYYDLGGVQFRIQDDSSLIYLESVNGDFDYVLSPPNSFSPGKWSHIAVTKQGNNCKLFINGIQVGYNQFDKYPSPDTLSIGARSKYMDRFFEGYIDEVRVWNTARSQSEIQDNMTSYLNGDEPDLYVYYRNNEGLGQKTYDLSPNAFNGRLGLTQGSDAGDPLWVQTDWPYEFSPSLDLKVFLEGPFNGTDMNTGLINSGLIPLSQPYNTSPWNYNGTENVAALPNMNIVDWVLVEYRDAVDANTATQGTVIGKQAAFLLNDGSVVDLDGSSDLAFDLTVTNSLFVAIYHRNHFPVISANALSRIGNTYSYDFTSSVSQAFGSGQKDLGGAAVMYGGDSNADGIVNDDDRTENWVPLAGEKGYLNGDVNLDGQVSNQDKNDIWQFNLNQEAQMPESGSFNCGDPLVDPRDNQSYNTVQIGEQCWMAQNLNVGTMINSNSSGDNQSDNGIFEKYCYGNDSLNCDEYGGLYQWGEAMQYTTEEGTQGICPEGWHLPANGEYCTMATFLDPTVNCTAIGLTGTDAGGKMKETGYDHWINPNTGATNESGFAGLPDAYRYYNGNFDYMGYYGYFWQSTDYGSEHYYWYLAFNSGKIGRNHTPYGFGFSVRCVKDDVANLPPEAPSNPQPENGASGQPVNLNLSWSCSDPESDPLTYDVYFGDSNPPSLISEGQTNTSFDPGSLNYFTDYFWKIIAYDDFGNTTEGSVWNFTTETFVWTCGDTIIDSRDGRVYNTVLIGEQCWMAENLNIGIRIDGANDMGDNGIIEKYCYDDLETNCDIYGGLYQWREIMEYVVGQGAQGICPANWHTPTKNEWITLVDSVEDDGNALKAIGQGTGAGAGTNTSGFTALLQGERNDSGFSGLGTGGIFWTSTLQSGNWAYWRGLNATTGVISGGAGTTGHGWAVRCLKND